MEPSGDGVATHKPFVIAMGVLFAAGTLALVAAWWMLDRVERKMEKDGPPPAPANGAAEPR